MSFDLKITAGDIKISSGNVEILTGKDKLKQDITKIILTELGSNQLQPWYGSMVSQSLIGNSLPDEVIFSIAQSQLQNCVETLKQLQVIQTASGQKMTVDESISYIQGVSIQRDNQDLRILKVSVNVLTRAFGTVNVSFIPQ